MKHSRDIMDPLQLPSTASSHEKRKDADHSALDDLFHTSMTENFFQESTDDVFEKYEIMEEGIREGEFGPIHKIKPKDDSSSNLFRVYALKTIPLNRVSRLDVHHTDVKNEINALKALDHPNIIKLYEVFYNNDSVHMIQEYFKGDDLYYRAPYSEREAARISSQLASAVAHMHEMGVIHGDLKFESIFFEHSGPNAAIKVTDFGFAKKVRSGDTARNKDGGGGTIYNMAPEVLQGNYTTKADSWSMGVIIYMMLSSQVPFYAKRSKNMIAFITRGRYSRMEGPVWDEISVGAKHLVANLLLVDSTERYTAKQALEHIWLRKWIQSSDSAPSEAMLNAVNDSLRKYRHSTTLKKLALNIIAHKSTTQEIIALRKVFDSIDKSHNGTVDLREFKEGMKESHLSEEELAQLFESIDVDKSGEIQYTEWLAATLEARGYLEEERISEAFYSIDRDGSGFIDRDKLKGILGTSYTAEQIDEIIRVTDKNNDGRISYDDFFDVFRDQTMILAAQVGDIDEPTEVFDEDDDFFGNVDFDFDPNASL